MKDEKSDLFSITFNDGEKGLFGAMTSAERACEEHGVESEHIFLVKLCMEELVTNALRYGSNGTTPICFEISIRFSDPDLGLDISDDANPFNPLTEAPEPDLESSIENRKPGGLGIHLLKTMTRSIQYEYKDHRNTVNIKI